MRILITGSNGVIGKVLVNNLPYEITQFDLPDYDARNYKQLLEISKHHNAIIHMGWDTKTDNYKSGELNPDNILMAQNIYKAACENKISRVIMASSNHADSSKFYKTAGLMSPYGLPTPDSPYGAGKCMVEALGRYYANYHELQVICLRIGGLNADDDAYSPLNSTPYIWLSHRDCTSLVKCCLEAEHFADNYAIIYAVSDNAGRIHDITNPVGWKPVDGRK
jgi:nucleoside-diphosphate-sugar epimerase